MRRAPVLAAAVLAAGAAAPSAQAAVDVPTRLQVSAREWGYALSRLQVKTGPAIVELVNFGEDDHDLRVRRVGGTRTLVVPLAHPGARSRVRARLYAGRYRLWCSLPNHRERGMRATLRVRRP